MQHQLVKKLLSSPRFNFFSSTSRLLSASLPSAEAINGNPPTKSPFAVEYLVNSCGLPMDKAIIASKHVPHLKSPAKADSVLQFLRESGLSNADIRKAVSSDPQLLCANLEKIVKPRIREAQEIGFSPSQIGQFVSISPSTFRSVGGGSLQERIKFWMPFFGSLEGILTAVKKAKFLLNVSVEKVIEPNISFLQEQCGISPIQIRKTLLRAPAMLTSNPSKLRSAAQKAKKLGIHPSAGLFMYSLHITLYWSPSDLDAKIKNLKNIGFSKEEIESMVKRQPMLLSNSTERIRKSVDFLTSEAGLDLAYVALHPPLLSLSLERRMIPRHCVMKSLNSKGLCESWSFSSVMILSAERFANRFLRPYRDIIPEAIQAYESSIAR